jgi:putative phosphoesterase
VTVVAVVSDTHLPRGGRRLPKECLEYLAEADLILHAGDFVAEGVLRDLERIAPVEAVHGNMDDAALRRRLPARRVVEIGGTRVGMVHDAGPRVGRHGRLAAGFPGCQAVVYGHTHEPEITLQQGVWIVNPGSPTERRRAPTRAMALFRLAPVFEAELVTLT